MRLPVYVFDSSNETIDLSKFTLGSIINVKDVDGEVNSFIKKVNEEVGVEYDITTAITEGILESTFTEIIEKPNIVYNEDFNRIEISNVPADGSVEIEIATDDIFSNILESSTTNENYFLPSFTPTDSTLYVRAKNIQSTFASKPTTIEYYSKNRCLELPVFTLDTIGNNFLAENTITISDLPQNCTSLGEDITIEFYTKNLDTGVEESIFFKDFTLPLDIAVTWDPEVNMEVAVRWDDTYMFSYYHFLRGKTKGLNNVDNVDILGDGSAILLYQFEESLNDAGGIVDGTFQVHPLIYDNNIVKHGQYSLQTEGYEGVTIPLKPADYPEISVSFWSYYDSAKSDPTGCLWGVPSSYGDDSTNNGNAFTVFITETGLQMSINNEVILDDIDIIGADEWQHFIFTSEGNMFLNGVLIASNNSVIYNPKRTESGIGFLYDYDSSEVNDFVDNLYIDQARLFKKNLTEAEAKFIYDNEK